MIEPIEPSKNPQTLEAGANISDPTTQTPNPPAERSPLGIPQSFKGTHRRRNFLICQDYIKGMSAEEIKKDRGLLISISQIERIISAHSAYICEKMAWPKFKRIHKLQRIATRLDGVINLKRHDEIDALEALSREIGDTKQPVGFQQTNNIVMVEINQQNCFEPPIEINPIETEDEDGNGAI